VKENKEATGFHEERKGNGSLAAGKARRLRKEEGGLRGGCERRPLAIRQSGNDPAIGDFRKLP